MKRTATITRKTKETDIKISLELESEKESKIKTSIPFLSHMLELFARHGKIFLDCDISGDIDVDLHHTIEDSGIVLGTAFKEALQDKKGINRYGSILLPMDESLVQVAIDLSGRPHFKYDIGNVSGKIGNFDVEHCRHFFESFTYQLQLNLHIKLLYGEDKHHIIEAIFKGVARALAQAVEIKGDRIPSTKEIL